MAIAMLCIPVVDGLAKYLSAGYSPLFIGWARYAVACLIVLPIAALMHGARLFPTERLGSHVLRTFFLVTSMTLYFLSIPHIPLATATSAYFIGPIAAALLAVLILKEQMTWQKVVSLVLGFAGALVILQPGAPMQPALLLAFAAGILFAFYMITTRQAATQSDPVKTLAFQCAVGVALLTPPAVTSWSIPAWNDLLFFLGLGLFSAVAHLLSIAAFRMTEASTLAPLVYLELVGVAVFGYLVFDEVPGVATVLGAALIMAAGLMLVGRSSPAR